MEVRKMKKIGNRLIVGLFVLVFIFVSIAGLRAVEAAEKVYKIGIATIMTHPALDAARDGFIDQMAKEGFIEGKNVKYMVKSAEGDANMAYTIAKNFVSQKVDMIQSISTMMSQAAYNAAKGTDIPIVFSGVTDPLKARLIESWEKPGGNVTGVSDWVEIGPQVKVFVEILPTLRRLGVLYNPGEVNAVSQLNDLKAVAPSHGIKEIVEAAVPTTGEAMTATQSLVGKVDAIWIPQDTTTNSAATAIAKICENNKIPFFGSHPTQVKDGIIVAMGLDMYVNGKEAGMVAARILRGEKPGNIAVKRAELSDMHVNPAAAKRMGITIPKSVMDRATKIINK
jgi:putative ABC transport system substrate-binding protein